MEKAKTYVEGAKITFRTALDLFEKLVSRKATPDEKNQMRRAWLKRRRARKESK